MYRARVRFFIITIIVRHYHVHYTNVVRVRSDGFWAFRQRSKMEGGGGNLNEQSRLAVNTTRFAMTSVGHLRIGFSTSIRAQLGAGTNAQCSIFRSISFHYAYGHLLEPPLFLILRKISYHRVCTRTSS